MMKITLKTCCKVISIIVWAVTLFHGCSAAPLDTYYPGGDNDVQVMGSPQRMQILKELNEMINLGNEKVSKDVDPKQYAMPSEPSGLWRVMPQKRFRPFRTQTRAGGVALCLWKVCPAAPWLVSKRR